MKGRHIKILTIFGLIAIIALQTIWLCNAYIQFSQSIYTLIPQHFDLTLFISS